MISLHELTFVIHVLLNLHAATNAGPTCCVPYLVNLSFLFIIDMAEILSKKEINGKNIYYIHFDDCKCILKSHRELQIRSKCDFLC